MARWIVCLLLVSLFLLASMGATHSAAQGAVTASAVTANPPDGGLPGRGMPPRGTPVYAYPTILLTLSDNGRTFTIPVNTVIGLQLPLGPRSRLIYDPSILQPLPAPVSGDAYPQFTPRRLIAVSPGTTILAVEPAPCLTIPCPEMPSIQFRVTIIVTDGLPPVQPTLLPPLPVSAPAVYIGTAYLNQTVTVQVSQLVILDLPSLDSRTPVTIQFDPAILRPLTGLTYPQPSGWRFQVVQPGTTTLTVQGANCSTGGTDCPPTIYFQVTLTTGVTTP